MFSRIQEKKPTINCLLLTGFLFVNLNTTLLKYYGRFGWIRLYLCCIAQKWFILSMGDEMDNIRSDNFINALISSLMGEQILIKLGIL